RMLDVVVAGAVVRGVRIVLFPSRAAVDVNAVRPIPAAAGSFAAAVEDVLLAQVDDLLVEDRDRPLDRGRGPEGPAASALTLVANRRDAGALRAPIPRRREHHQLVGRELLRFRLARIGRQHEPRELTELTVHRGRVADRVTETVRVDDLLVIAESLFELFRV